VTLTATPKARRLLATILSCLAGVMVVGAIGLLGYPEYTNLRADRKQAALRVEFANASAKLKAAYAAASLGGKPVAGGTSQITLAEGSPITRIQIPKISVDTVVVQGTSPQALAAGAGHYPTTPLPCSTTGNVGIAGHRTMNGHPFQDLNRMAPGDKITLITPFESCVYQVVTSVDGHANPWVTAPNDWTVVAQTQQPMLTLTTCTPEGTATQRIAVRAMLISHTNLAPGSTAR
jgi:LPXTG-site transpeptidase (sortase) family protein